jgi:hypothetical protein
MSRELISTGNELAALAAIDSKCEFFGSLQTHSIQQVYMNLVDMVQLSLINF